MSARLSLDLRKRIAAAHAARDGTNEEIAARFQVSRTTVERLGRRLREGTGLEPGKSTGRPKVLLPKHYDGMAKELPKDPYLGSYGLAARFRKHFRHVKLHRSTVLRAMHDLGFSFKKNSLRPSRRSP